MNKQIHGIDNEVRALFSDYWPGNIRELQNVIEGAFNTTGFKTDPYGKYAGIPA